MEYEEFKEYKPVDSERLALRKKDDLSITAQGFLLIKKSIEAALDLKEERYTVYLYKHEKNDSFVLSFEKGTGKVKNSFVLARRGEHYHFAMRRTLKRYDIKFPCTFEAEVLEVKDLKFLLLTLKK